MDDDELITVLSQETLAKMRNSALLCLGGAVLLFLLTIGARFRFLSMVLSLAALTFGLIALFSKDRGGKKPGLVLAAAGVLGMFTRFGGSPFRPFAGALLGLGAVGLLAAGLWKGVVFLFAVKKRG